MDPHLPAQLAQRLAPSLCRRVGATPAAFVEEASRETVHEGGQRMHGGLPVFVYSFPIR
jgi:hypothetical protein